MACTKAPIAVSLLSAVEESQLLQPLLPDAKDEAGSEDGDNATILKDAKVGHGS